MTTTPTPTPPPTPATPTTPTALTTASGEAHPPSPLSYLVPAFVPPLLPVAPRLFVPVAAPDGCPAAGTKVNRGDPLLTTTIEGQRVPRAPAAGTIVGVTQVPRLGIGPSPAIEIEVSSPITTDGGGATGDRAASPPLPQDLAALLDQLRRGGVHADRHCSPDLLGQLKDAQGRKIDIVLCNLLDPAGESDLMATVARAAGDAIVAGADILAKASGANRIWFAVDARAAAAIGSAVRKAGLAGLVALAGGRAKVVEIPNHYPQADPTLLLYALLRRRLEPGRLPTHVGALLLDGPAAAAVGRCAADNQPMLDVTVEVRESDRQACSVRSVAVGTPLRYLLEQLWLRPERLTLRAGAALREVRVGADAVIDGVGELSIDAGPVSPIINPDPCIRCGWCVEACPVRIHPAGLLEAAQDNDFPAAQWYGLPACIECGICSYVCPSRLPLLPAIRDLRANIARREVR